MQPTQALHVEARRGINDEDLRLGNWSLPNGKRTCGRRELNLEKVQCTVILSGFVSAHHSSGYKHEQQLWLFMWVLVLMLV